MANAAHDPSAMKFVVAPSLEAPLVPGRRDWVDTATSASNTPARG